MKRRASLRLSPLPWMPALLLAAAGCQDKAFDFQSQVGPQPVLPEPRQELFPDMEVAKVVGWGEGEKPVVARGLQVAALATGLQNPRNVYVLPNGDVLVVEARSPDMRPRTRPKDIVRGGRDSRKIPQNGS